MKKYAQNKWSSGKSTWVNILPKNNWNVFMKQWKTSQKKFLNKSYYYISIQL